jgi:capsid protein
LLAGAIPRLLPGEKVTSHKSDRPATTFSGFLDYLLRDVANGLGVPWEFVWDASKLGGSTNRLAIQKAQRKFEERQRLLIKLATRDWGYVVSKAAKRGDLPQNDDWWRVVWQTPRKITVDEGRDSKENRNDIFAGLRTVSEDYAERGFDYEVSRDQQEREIDDLLERAGRIAKKHGITIEKALDMLQQRSSNPPAIGANPTGAEPVPGES